MPCRLCISCIPSDIAKSATLTRSPNPSAEIKQQDKETTRVPVRKVDARNIRNEHDVVSGRGLRQSSPTRP